MNWRLILLPFSWIYGIGVGLRNVFYNIGVFKSTSPDVKTICVGNLSVGGTGKTPHVEWIANYLLEKSLAVAIRRAMAKNDRVGIPSTKDVL